MAIWHALRAICDAMVDSTFGEPVELIPMIPGAAGVDPMPDPNRSPIVVVGCFVRPGASIVGEGGLGYAMGGSSGRVVQQDVWVSIVEGSIGSVNNWHRGDRVFLPERDEMYELNYIQLSATERPDLHLTRVQKADE